MQKYIVYQQIGLLLTLLGTIALAFSVQTTRQYQGKMAEAVTRLKQQDPEKIEPTETYIILWLFRGGLVLAAIGTFLQWLALV